MSTTALYRNPFWLLGASTRDDSRRLIELADERSLTHDPQACQHARATLSNPRTRLAAELSWLPGISPTRAVHLADKVLTDPLSLAYETGLPALAHANLLAAVFESPNTTTDAKTLADLIQRLADLASQCTTETMVRELNEDRSIAGFPTVKPEALEAEWQEQTRYYRVAVKDSLNRLPTQWIIEAVSVAVDRTTYSGTVHAPALIDELVGSYEIECQPFLHAEALNIEKIVAAIREEAKSRGPAVNCLIDTLSHVVRKWDTVAQPIQLNARVRGVQHALSQNLAFTIRELAVDLTNEYNCMAESQRLTDLIAAVFAELPDVHERAGEDTAALQRLLTKQRQSAEELESWKKDISCEVEFGTLFKDTFRLSAEGISWKQKLYSLSAISRIRYGGLKESGGVTFTVAFGDATSEGELVFRGEELFNTIIDKLWRAVGHRLAFDLLQCLRGGTQVTIGNALLTDERVLLTQHSSFGDDSVWCSWQDVQVWAADGDFYIGSAKDDTVYEQLSYIRTWNAHVLELVLRAAFKHPGGFHRLSDTFLS